METRRSKTLCAFLGRHPIDFDASSGGMVESTRNDDFHGLVGSFNSPLCLDSITQ